MFSFAFVSFAPLVFKSRALLDQDYLVPAPGLWTYSQQFAAHGKPATASNWTYQ
jgi:hypothetical protein